MSIVVVVLLVVLWAWILLPGAVRERRDASPASSVSRFEQSMAQLARARPVKAVRRLSADEGSGPGIWVLEGPEVHPNNDAAGRAAKRRRQVVTGLTAATTVVLVAAQLLGGVLWLLFWFAALLLVTYLLLLVERWVRISREEALPLVRPPGRERASAVEKAGASRGATQVREVADFKLDTEAVRVVEW